MSQYYRTINKIHAPQEQIDKALDRVYQPRLEEIRPQKAWRGKALGGLAAALAVAVGITAIAVSSGTHSAGFSITANAAEITTGDFVTLGSLNPGGSGSGTTWNQNEHVLSISSDKCFKLFLKCEGEGIERVTYTVSDGAYFGLIPGTMGVSDVAPYSNTHSLADDEHTELATSYTVDGAFDVTPNLIFTAEEKEGKYCRAVEDMQVFGTDESGAKVIKNYSWSEDVCCDMFNEYIDPKLDITATYRDGHAETRRVVFEFAKGTIMGREYNEEEAKPHTIVEVKAKLDE